MRPATLSEVAARVRAGEAFDLCLAEFLDEFYRAPSAVALAETPALLQPQFGRLGAVCDAYLAATAEEVARQHAVARPSWTGDPGRALHTPWFASPSPALRALLLVESPPSFRARNLFVSENALSRV